jgi:hypothetical protein
VSDAFDRLSRREKVMVLTLGLVLGLCVIVVVHLTVRASVNEKEAELETDRELLEKIYAQSGDYLESLEKTERIKASASKSADINVKLKLNEIARSISFESIDQRGNPQGSKTLERVLQWEGQTERFLSKKKKKKGDKKKKKKEEESDVGYYEREIKLTLNEDVPFKAIYEFLEKVESSDDLFFVTGLELNRKVDDGRFANRRGVQITISSYYYKGTKEEEKAKGQEREKPPAEKTRTERGVEERDEG